MTEKFIGIQLGSHTVFDEGVDHCLDTMQEAGGINAVFVYSNTYHTFAAGRDPEALADDHGVPVRDPRTRKMTNLWVKHHDEYFADTFLRYKRVPGEEEYADRDVFEELIEPLRKRDMKLYARILEGWREDLPPYLPNWVKIGTVDIYGRINHLPCFNNPAYRMYWLSTVEDLFKSYPLDGFKYGSERSGPLSNLFFAGTVPTCFCEHCRRRGQERGIDIERAQRGWRELYEWTQRVEAGDEKPVDGVAVTLMRFLLKYPEILAWENMWHETKEEVASLMYGAIKAIKPEAQVGWHVYHNNSWDPLFRAATDYSEMAHYSDWIKPVVYHDIAGPRIHRDIVRLRKTILQELSEDQSVGLLYALLGYDAAREPAFADLTSRGLSEDYVYSETRRCVVGVQGRAVVYAGVGFDVPWGSKRFYSDPELTYKATYRAFEAGAQGLVVSREYDEMRLDSLRAVKRAVQDATAAGL